MLRTSRSRLAIATALAALSVACAGPMSSDMGGSMGSGSMPGQMEGMHHGAEGQAPDAVDGAPSVEVTATDLAFDTETIEVTAGEPINITLTNDGETFHDLHVEEADFMLDADPGQTSTGALTIDEPGTYEFRCTVPGHASAGMTGAVVVS